MECSGNETLYENVQNPTAFKISHLPLTLHIFSLNKVALYMLLSPNHYCGYSHATDAFIWTSFIHICHHNAIITEVTAQVIG